MEKYTLPTGSKVSLSNSFEITQQKAFENLKKRFDSLIKIWGF